jgi:hypothetical protein
VGTYENVYCKLLVLTTFLCCCYHF